MMDLGMLYPAVVHRGITNVVSFNRGHSLLRLLDADGANVLLSMRLDLSAGCVFINDQVRDVWGQRVSIALPEEDSKDRLSLTFKLGQTLEIWNAQEVLVFERFGDEAAAQVRFCLLQNATNPGDTLSLTVPRPEEMAAQIASRIAHKRMDGLERQLLALKGTAPATGPDIG